MFRKRCARNNIAVWPETRTRLMELRDGIFFFVLAVVLFAPFFIISPSPAFEMVAASTPVQPVSAPEGKKQENAAAVPPVLKATTPLVVNLSVNLESKGDFFVELDKEGGLFIKVEDLNTLKLKFAEEKTVLIRDERYAPLSAVLDVKYFFDEKNLTVSIVGKTTEAGKTSVDLFSLRSRPQNVYYPRETSVFLNYGLSYASTHADETGTPDSRSFTASNKVGIRSGDVFFVSDSLYTKTGTSEQFVRLQSSATYERRDDLQWFVLGDQFANSGDLGSTINMGGLGFSKVYRLDPYFITQPVFNLQGATVFPSQAEIYMDGVLIGKQAIAPGTFDLRNIYSYTGSHRLEVVLKDPFGNEQRIFYPLYFSAFMLREGLHEYSYNAGFLRENYGVTSDEYSHKPAFSAFHRYGITNFLNIGARAEGFDGIYNGGLSTSFLVPRAGAFTVSLAESSANGTKGSAGSLQHTYQRGSFSTNLLLRAFSRDYSTVSSPTTSVTIPTKYETSVGAGLLLAPLGSFSLGYSESETWDENKTRVTTASYSRGLSLSTSLFATTSATRQAGMTTYSVFVGLNVNFDRNIRGSAQYSKTGNTNTETAQIQKDVPVGEGLGYRATASRSDTGTATTESLSPFVQYNARYGIYSIDSSMQDSSGAGSESYTLSAAGSLVYAGGFYGLSRPVSDSFGIVMLDKLPGAMVLNNGQEIGKTGPSGMMVVPTLASYSQNEITLDVKNIPMEYSVSGVNKALSPSLWSGSCVAFDATKVQALTGNLFALQDKKKNPVENGEGTIMVGAQSVTFLTGKGGEFYIENTLPKETKEAPDQQSCRSIAERRAVGGKTIKPGAYPAFIDYDDKKCEFKIVFPETEDVITELGEIVCNLPQERTQPQPVPVPKIKKTPSVAPIKPAVRETSKSGVEDNPPRSIVVRFRVDSKGANVTTKDKKAVAALVRFLMKNPGSFVKIEGHADRHGSDAAAVRLGMRTAEAARNYLVRSGVKPGRIKKTESFGRSKMLCTQETAVCDARNRRAVVSVVQEEEKAGAAIK